MSALISRLRSCALLREIRGANLVEYIVIIGLVTLIGMVCVSTFRAGRNVEDRSGSTKP